MNLERNLAEMAQGKLVSQRAARLEQLARWQKARKISMRFSMDGTKRQAWLYQSSLDLGAEMGLAFGTLLAECEANSDYPSEAFVAQVALGIQAFSNFDGVEGPKQQEKSESAKHVIDWKKWAPA